MCIRDSLVLYLGLGILFEYVMKIPMGFYNVPIIIAFLVAILAVSYTHLDVYKRQICISRNRVLSGLYKKRKCCFWDSSSYAVSYTHLVLPDGLKKTLMTLSIGVILLNLFRVILNAFRSHLQIGRAHV